MLTDSDIRLIIAAQDTMLAARPLGKLHVSFSEQHLGADGRHMVEVSTPSMYFIIERSDYLKYFNSIHPIN